MSSVQTGTPGVPGQRVTNFTTESSQENTETEAVPFCGTEERVSTHVCNSQYPSISIDEFGNRGIVWQDNRDGNYEIYFNILPPKVSIADALKGSNSVFDPKAGRIMDLSCSTNFNNNTITLASVCSSTESGSSETGNTIRLRRPDGRLTVDDVGKRVFLTADDGGTNFLDTGIVPNWKTRIETGKNSGKELLVLSVLGSTSLQLSYDASLQNDSDFIYSIIDVPATPITSCEARLTCSRESSLFPDVIADRECRWHILYHDDETGKNELYYVQVAPPSNLNRSCNSSNDVAIQRNGVFGTTTNTTLNTYVFRNSDTPKYYSKNGLPGQFFAYGNRSMPLAKDGDTGLHTIFRDYANNEGEWVGLSRAYDANLWSNFDSSTVSPSYTATNDGILYKYGDFGQTFNFNHLVFQAVVPPDIGIELSTVVLPFIPRCTPENEPNSFPGGSNTNLVSAPKRPLPPTFVDPVDISSLLNSPFIKFTNEPARFTVDGDQSGTVFTNVLLENASGELSRVLFRQEDSGTGLKFVLGMTQCGDTNCAVKFKDSLSNNQQSTDTRYKIRLQVWQGQDYRVDEAFIDSGRTKAVRKLFDKEFFFDGKEDLATFSFLPGEVRVPRGTILFFSAIPGDNVDLAVRGTAGGTSLWLAERTDTGDFTQFSSPFTVPPFEGLNLPIYYDGYLADIPNDSETTIGTTTQVQDADLIDTDPGLGFLDQLTVSNKNQFGISVVQPTTTPGKLITSIATPTLPQTNFDGISYGGVTSVFSTQSTLTGYIKLASDGTNVYAGTTTGSVIYRVTSTGTTSLVTLGSGLVVTDIYHDGENMYVTTVNVNNEGEVYRLSNISTSSATATKIADIPEYIEGIYVVPDEQRYGPMAGAVVVGARSSKTTYTIKNSEVRQLFLGIGLIDLLVVPYEPTGSPNVTALNKAGQSLYITSGDGVIYAAATESISDFSGELVLMDDAGGGWLATWEENKYILTKVFQVGSIRQAVFASFKVVPLCTNTGSGSSNDCVAVDTTTSGVLNNACSGNLSFTKPKKITFSKGSSEHARMGIKPNGDVFAVFHSNRDGDYDIYCSRYFGRCNVWNASGTGGDDLRLSYFANDGRKAMFPKVAMSARGEAHVVFQGTDKDGKWQIWYCHSTGGGVAFTKPVQLSNSADSSGAMVPDIAVSYDDNNEIITVVWHQDKSGFYDIYAANRFEGKWNSTFQGGQDTRVTESKGQSLYPRISSDKDGNLRVVFHSDRTGHAEVFMSTFVAKTKTWSSSGTGGKDIKISNGPTNSNFPDIAIDKTGGVGVVWHDDRHMTENPDIHEEVYCNYCPSLGSPYPHFPPLSTSDEAFLEQEFSIVDCTTLQEIEYTSITNVCLKIRAPGATFWRAGNASEPFSEWQQFQPNLNLDTSVVPWELSCGNGIKQICVQIQNADNLGFPVCKTISLVSPAPKFRITFHTNAELTELLPSYKNYPAIKSGIVYVRIESDLKQIENPTFDVIHQGSSIILGQKTELVPQIAGQENSTVQVFRGKFSVFDDDGLYHRDGLARVIVRSKQACVSGNDVIEQGEYSLICKNDELESPPQTDPSPEPPIGFSGSGTDIVGPYNSASASSYLSLTVNASSEDVDVIPTIDSIPYKLTLGAVAQPFTVSTASTSTLTIRFKAGRRSVPSWLSSFLSRGLKVELYRDFLGVRTQMNVYYVYPQSIPEVDFDPITGLMNNPSSLNEVSDTVLTTQDAVSLEPGVVYAIVISDDTYVSSLPTYGANAKYFVVGVGTNIVSGQYPYYYRDY